MAQRTYRTARRLSAAGLVAAVLIAGCRHAQPAPEPRDDSQLDQARAAPACEDDPLVGWYATPDGGLLIPVLKRAGVYYSVCRGFEVQFRPTPEGLGWGAEPSSMTGTTIGFDPATGARYLAVFDEQAANFTDGRSGTGEQRTIVRTERPAWLRDPTAAPPQSLDDFLGWYEPIWFPGLRWEVRKEGAAYVVVYGVEAPPSTNSDWGHYELKPLPDRLGFTGFERGNDEITLAYNDALRRYELCIRRTCETRMPVARIAAPPTTAPAQDEAPRIRVGIPSWH